MTAAVLAGLTAVVVFARKIVPVVPEGAIELTWSD